MGTRKAAVTTSPIFDWLGRLRASGGDVVCSPGPGFCPCPVVRARGHSLWPGLGRGGAPGCRATARHRPQ